MRALARILVGLSLLACAGLGAAPAAGPPATVAMEVLAAQGVIPTYPTHDKRGTWAQLPYLKLYIDGELRAAGLPAEFAQLDSATLQTASPHIPAQIKLRKLSQELKLLNIRLTPAARQVLVIYVSMPCPPCEHLIEPVLRRLSAAGQAVEQIRVGLN